MISATIRYTGIVGMSAEEFRQRFTTPMLRAMGLYWFRSILPRHFGTDAARRYGYTPRKKNYLMRKARAVHHQRPLEFSGTLRRMTLGAYGIAEQKWSVGGKSGVAVRLILPGARGANLRHPKSQVRMRDEITAIIPEEATELIRFGNAYMRSALRNVPRSRIVTIR